jgi:hypothetical protein
MDAIFERRWRHLGIEQVRTPFRAPRAKDVIEAPSLEPLRKVDSRKSVESVLAFVERYKLPDHLREDFLSSYEGDRFVESLRFVRSYKTELPELSKLLPNLRPGCFGAGEPSGTSVVPPDVVAR